MPPLAAFSTPAKQQDFPVGSPEQAVLDALWNDRVQGFTLQAILGDPWNSLNQSNQVWYYDPTDTDIPQGTASVLVFWNAFPNRLAQYLGAGATPANPYEYTQEQLLQMADEPDFTGIDIPATHCPVPDWNGPGVIYGPYGPRGWLDEYCEWSVTRDPATNKIVRVDFVCENPEYWYSLWRVSPDRVAEIYQETLNAGAPAGRQVTVTVDDLQLYDPSSGQPVVDPETDGPAYNPLNKWNAGTHSIRTGAPSDSGGAMHLTSTPNTLQTELGLAGGATVQRTQGNADPQALICCSQYGQSYRNSDPHIGQSVNVVVSEGNRVSLADPVGLYIQMPNFNRYQLPSDPNLPPDAQPSDCWQVIRGAETLTDPVTGQPYPGNFFLHVAFQIPQAWTDAGVKFTVGDITIAGKPIQWAGQIAQTFDIGLFPRPLPAAAPAAEACVANAPNPTPQPLQLFHASLWDAYYGSSEPVAAGQPPLSLASNTVIVPPIVQPGATGVELALTCSGVTPGQAPAVSFDPGPIAVSSVTPPVDVNYAVPGNSYPGAAQVVKFTIDAPPETKTGLWGVTLANQGQSPGPPAPAFLSVAAL